MLSLWKRFISMKEIVIVLLCLAVLANALRKPGSQQNQYALPKPFNFPMSKIANLAILLQPGDGKHGEIFEALDYLCPPCHMRESQFAELRRENPLLSWSVLPFPLHMHPGSYGYALAALEANREGLYNLYQQKVMSEFPAAGIGPERYLRNLDPELVRSWQLRFSNKSQEESRLNQIKKLPIDGTPTLIAFNSVGKAIKTFSPGDAMAFCKS